MKCIVVLSMITMMGCRISPSVKHQDQGSTLKVDGGERSGDAQWPQAVLIVEKIGNKTIRRCSGVILSSRVVLTAAHCVVGANSKNLYVITGQLAKPSTQDMQDNRSRRPDAVYFPSAFEVHPLYNHDTRYADLAKVYFDSDLPTSRPMALPLKDIISLEPGREAMMVGFGISNFSTPMEKRHATQNFLAGYDDQTQRFYLLGQNGHACGGDSGGPVFVQENAPGNPWHIAGLVTQVNSVEVVDLETNVSQTRRISLMTPLAPFQCWIDSPRSGATCKSPFDFGDKFRSLFTGSQGRDPKNTTQCSIVAPIYRNKPTTRSVGSTPSPVVRTPLFCPISPQGRGIKPILRSTQSSSKSVKSKNGSRFSS